MKRLLLGIALVIGFSSCARSQVDIDNLEGRLHSILQMPLYEMIYRDVIYIGEEASFLGFKHIDTKLLFSIQIRIEAGLRMDEGIKLQRNSDGSVRVQLPQPEILLLDADESSIQQYFLKERGKEIKRLDYYQEIAKGKKRIREEALQSGIIETSQQRARRVIEQILRPAVQEEIYIDFIKAETGADL